MPTQQGGTGNDNVFLAPGANVTVQADLDEGGETFLALEDVNAHQIDGGGAQRIICTVTDYSSYFEWRKRP